MAAGSITTQVVPHAGLTVTTTSPTATDGDTCQTGGGVFYLVSNTSGSAVTVTCTTPGTVDGNLAIADRTVSAAANGITLIPMLDLYRSSSTGRATVTCATTTGVKVAVIRVATS